MQTCTLPMNDWTMKVTFPGWNTLNALVDHTVAVLVQYTAKHVAIKLSCKEGKCVSSMAARGSRHRRGGKTSGSGCHSHNGLDGHDIAGQSGHCRLPPPHTATAGQPAPLGLCHCAAPLQHPFLQGSLTSSSSTAGWGGGGHREPLISGGGGHLPDPPTQKVPTCMGRGVCVCVCKA